MYFLGDLDTLQELVDQASKPGHGPKPKDSRATGDVKDITTDTPSPADTGPDKSIPKEDNHNGTQIPFHD